MDSKIELMKAHYPAYVRETIEQYEKLFPQAGLGVYGGFEWNRVGFASQLATGNSVLDVGVGNGALLAMLWRSGRFKRVCGIDIRRMTKLRLTTPAEFRLMNVTDLEFADGEFDTILCMEVIEHLPVDQVDPALAQLRRVARQRLIMTVPYNEPYPLFHQKSPGGHKQSFDMSKLRRLFPSASLTELPWRRVNWMLIVETPQIANAGFRLRSGKELSKEFGVTRLLGAKDLLTMRQRLTSSFPKEHKARKLIGRIVRLVRKISNRWKPVVATKGKAQPEADDKEVWTA